MSPAPETTPANPHHSDRRNAANRENARHSTGPRTHKGKDRVRHNGLKHGLTGQVTVMPWEDHQAHDQFCRELIANYAPAGPEERNLANMIAEDYWRLNRIRAIEQNIFALGCATTQLEIDAHPNMRYALLMAQSFLENAKSLNLLSLYESRITRNLHRNRAELTALKAARPKEVEQARPEAAVTADLIRGQVGACAVPLVEPAHSSIERSRPANGFAFSTPRPTPPKTPAARPPGPKIALPHGETIENSSLGGFRIAA